MKRKLSIKTSTTVKNTLSVKTFAISSIILSIAALGLFLYKSLSNETQLMAATQNAYKSAFDWELASGTAASGPNAISISNSTTLGPGVNGNGLNPGLPKKDINMVLPGSLLDIAGLEFNIDFQRDESYGFFITRGNFFQFGMNGGKLLILYKVDNGSGSYNTVSAGNIYTIPNDDVFRTYNFKYDPNTGIGEISVNGSQVWSNTGTPGTALYFAGAGNIMIGDQMDGSGTNKVIFDNMYIDEITLNPLPVTFSSITGKHISENKSNLIQWSTSEEKNNRYFSIEKSKNEKDFESLGNIIGAGNSQLIQNYQFTDSNPSKGFNYYRIKQTDFDGNITYSQVINVNVPLEQQSKTTSIIETIGPNPFVNSFKLIYYSTTKDQVQISIMDLQGNTILEETLTPEFDGQNVYEFMAGRLLTPGTYILRIVQNNSIETTKVIKSERLAT